MKLSSITTDINAANAGKWFDYDDARFLIAAHMNPAHKVALQALGKRNARALRKNDPEISDRITIEAMSTAVLLDWQNITQDDGSPFPATPENRLKLLQTSAPLREFVAVTAMEHSNFLAGEEAASVEEIKSRAPVEPPVG